MKLSIRLRLALWFAALLAAIISMLGAFLAIQLGRDLRRSIDTEIRTSAATILNGMSDAPDELVSEHPADQIEDAKDFADAASITLPHAASGAQLLDGNGKVLLRYGSLAAREPLVRPETGAAALTGSDTTFTARLGETEQRSRVYVTAVPDRKAPAVLVVAASMQRVEDSVWRVVALLLTAGPAVLAAAAAGAYWLARKALGPIAQMTSDAREIGTDRLHERIAAPAANDEVGCLAETLNAMLHRIEKGVDSQHRLIADASHELRSPLAVMRTEIDVHLRGTDLPLAAREVLHSVREEVDRMSRTVDNLLTLAAADEGRLELLTSRVNLRDSLADAARLLRPLADAKGLRLLLEGEICQAQADPQRLHLALTNLVENAVKFAPSGSTVRLVSWCREGEVGVTVIDSGCGINAEDRQQVFDRFYRVDSARGRSIGGSGLGLAICREVAVAHGGRTWVDSEVAKGSAFSLALPTWRALSPAPEPHPPGAEREPHPPAAARAGSLVEGHRELT